MEIKLKYTPHQGQQVVHEAIDSGKYKFITVNGSRQSGKSKLVTIEVIKRALTENNKRVMVVSPKASQSKKIAKDIINPIKNSAPQLIKSATESMGNINCSFINGSSIDFKSAESKDSLRGNTVDYLFIDEAAFISEDTVNEILLPMVITRPNAVIIIVSTPKGKNWFYEYFQKGKSDEYNNYFSHKFTYEDNPLCDLDIIETFKRDMPEMSFRQEFLGEFIDSMTLFDNIADICILKPSESTSKEQIYVGIDIGLKNDYFVVIGLDKNGKQVLFERHREMDVMDIIKLITDLPTKYNIKKIYIEENNQGLPILQQLKRSRIASKIQGFITSAKSKPLIINNLITAFNKKELELFNDNSIISELETFEAYYSSSGAVKFQARSGHHDDIVMALAIAWECLNKNKMSGLNISWIR